MTTHQPTLDACAHIAERIAQEGLSGFATGMAIAREIRRLALGGASLTGPLDGAEVHRG